MSGKFIVLEGIDGSGTTTQRVRVAERLRARGHEVHETREPSDGPIGTLTRGLLAEIPGRPRTVDAAALALLFAADRLEHLAREIEPALARGAVVLCDRYVVSSWVYQSLDCDSAWVTALNEQARWPDLTLVLDIGPVAAMARVRARRYASGEPLERFDDAAAQHRIAAGYREILSRGLSGVVRINASASIEAVTDAIEAACIEAGL